jgi:hypothetical protein
MRLATTIISLVLMLGVGFQSCAVTVGAALGEDEQLAGGAAVGLLVAFLFLIGGAFAMAYPVVSLASFSLAGTVALAAGVATEFSDMTVWAFVSFVLAAMSFFGIREKWKQAQDQATRVR